MRIAASPDEIRKYIWDTAHKDERIYMTSYFSIMEFLCREYDAECVESLSATDYGNFLEDLESGRWKAKQS